jgi:hypothetical protein
LLLLQANMSLLFAQLLTATAFAALADLLSLLLL